jgi:MFS family permease
MSESGRASALRPQPRLPRNVKILGLASLLNDIASEMVFPLLPGFLLTVLGGSRFALGMVEGMADSVAGFLKLWSGGRSDLAGGRRRFVIAGYSLAALTRPLIGLISSPWQLLVLRTGDRFGKGIRTAPRDAIIADSTDPSNRGRAFGFHRAMDHLGAAVGPLLAYGFLRLWPDQLRTLFLVTLVPGLCVICLVVLGLRESRAERPSPARLRLTLRPFDRNFRVFLMALAIFTLGNSSDAFLLVRSEELGVPQSQLPVMWCAFHIVKSTGNLLLGQAVDRCGARPLLFLGWFVYAGIYLAFAMATTAGEAWGCFLGYALYYGLAEPAEKTLVTNLVGRERKGLAYGWYNFAIGTVSLPASLLFGALYQRYGAAPAFGSGALLALLAAIVLFAVKEPPSGITVRVSYPSGRGLG